MPRYTIDAPRAQLRVRTRAEGMFSPLAHDLELDFPLAEAGDATSDGAHWTVTLVARVDGVRVVGTVKRGVLDPRGLAPNDRAAVERKVREEVFADVREIRIEASGDGDNGRATVRASAGEAKVEVALDTRTELRVEGHAQVSLRALGLREVRGPLNAFRVNDTVTVRLSVELRAAG